MKTFFYDHQMALSDKFSPRIDVDFKINANNSATAHFIYLGAEYNFTMTRWQQKSFSAFRSKFHQIYTDTKKYGSSEIDPDTGDVVSSTCTSDQNKAIVLRAIKDIFLYLDVLLQTQPKSILDYAVWYREKHGSDVCTYADYVQLVTCHCIVQSDFLVGSVCWEVQEFVSEHYLNDV